MKTREHSEENGPHFRDHQAESLADRWGGSPAQLTAEVAIGNSPRVRKQWLAAEALQRKGEGGKASAVIQRMLKIGKDELYSEADLLKKKSLYNQLHAASVPAGVRRRVIRWLTDDDGEHEYGTMKLAIEAATREEDAANAPPPGPSSGPSSMSAPAPDLSSTSSTHGLEEKKTASASSSSAASPATSLEAELSAQKGKLITFASDNVVRIDGELRAMHKLLQTNTNPVVVMDLWRFAGTQEFDSLCAIGDLAKPCELLRFAASTRIKELGLSQMESLIQIIPAPWGVRDDVITYWKKNLIKDARHGASGGTAGPITIMRLTQTMAELQVCLPSLHGIFELCRKHELCRKPDDFLPLVLRVLEGTVRHFKAASMLKLMMFFDEAYPELMKLSIAGRIGKTAWVGLMNAVRDAVLGEGHRGKEQSKMLLAMLHHLDAHPDEHCIAYEPGNGANYDILMENDRAERTVVEVETIPLSDRAAAHAFYKAKYLKKLESIRFAGEAEGAVLMLYIPAETTLPLAQIALLRADPEIRIANLDEIEALSKKGLPD